MKRIICSFVPMAVLYVVFCFVSLEANPVEWAAEGRFLFAAFSVLGFGATYTCPVWYIDKC